MFINFEFFQINTKIRVIQMSSVSSLRDIIIFTVLFGLTVYYLLNSHIKLKQVICLLLLIVSYFEDFEFFVRTRERKIINLAAFVRVFFFLNRFTWYKLTNFKCKHFFIKFNLIKYTWIYCPYYQLILKVQ